jgi:hypothetical protein
MVPEVGVELLLRAADFESAWGFPKCLIQVTFYAKPEFMCKKMRKELSTPHSRARFQTGLKRQHGAMAWGDLKHFVAD